MYRLPGLSRVAIWKQLRYACTVCAEKSYCCPMLLSCFVLEYVTITEEHTQDNLKGSHGLSLKAMTPICSRRVRSCYDKLTSWRYAQSHLQNGEKIAAGPVQFLRKCVLTSGVHKLTNKNLKQRLPPKTTINFLFNTAPNTIGQVEHFT